MGMGGLGRGRKGALSEINVTPLVDVMLVLLVVFMITTPMIVEDMRQRKVEVDLPPTTAKPVARSDLQTVLILHKDFRIGLDMGEGETEVLRCQGGTSFTECLEPLEPKLKGNPKLKELERLFLMADRTLPYGFVVDVMARLKNAGFANLGMVTNPPEGEGEPQ